jgi:hypothetical protein
MRPGNISLHRISYRWDPINRIKIKNKIVIDCKSLKVDTLRSPFNYLNTYNIVDKEFRIFENLWQFSKLYPYVPKMEIVKNENIIWKQDYERHMSKKNIHNKHYTWKIRGYENKYPIKYPVGFKNRNSYKCFYFIKGILPNKNIISKNLCEYEMCGPYSDLMARSIFYIPMYKKLIRKTKIYNMILKNLRNGKNVSIIGPTAPVYGSNRLVSKFNELKLIYGKKVNLSILDSILNNINFPVSYEVCLAQSLIEDIYEE